MRMTYANQQSRSPFRHNMVTKFPSLPAIREESPRRSPATVKYHGHREYMKDNTLPRSLDCGICRRADRLPHIPEGNVSSIINHYLNDVGISTLPHKEIPRKCACCTERNSENKKLSQMNKNQDSIILPKPPDAPGGTTGLDDNWVRLYRSESPQLHSESNYVFADNAYENRDYGQTTQRSRWSISDVDLKLTSDPRFGNLSLSTDSYVPQNLSAIDRMYITQYSKPQLYSYMGYDSKRPPAQLAKSVVEASSNYQVAMARLYKTVHSFDH